MAEIWEGVRYAVASVGRGRWYWCAWSSGRAFFDGLDPAADGTEPTKGKALENATAAALALRQPGDPEPSQYPGKSARGWYRVVSARRQAARMANGSDSAPVGYIYHHSRYDHEGMPEPPGGSRLPEWCTCRHRVIRKTARFLWIVRDCHEATREWGGVTLCPPTIRLDRRKLEAGEEVWRDWHDYTLSPDPPALPRHPPDHLRGPLGALGLAWPCTEADVRRAYRRRARELHPDCGGEKEAMQQLNDAYASVRQAVGA